MKTHLLRISKLGVRPHGGGHHRDARRHRQRHQARHGGDGRRVGPLAVAPDPRLAGNRDAAATVMLAVAHGIAIIDRPWLTPSSGKSAIPRAPGRASSGSPSATWTTPAPAARAPPAGSTTISTGASTSAGRGRGRQRGRLVEAAHEVLLQPAAEGRGNPATTRTPPPCQRTIALPGPCVASQVDPPERGVRHGRTAAVCTASGSTRRPPTAHDASAFLPAPAPRTTRRAARPARPAASSATPTASGSAARSPWPRPRPTAAVARGRRRPRTPPGSAGPPGDPPRPRRSSAPAPGWRSPGWPGRRRGSRPARHRLRRTPRARAGRARPGRTRTASS